MVDPNHTNSPDDAIAIVSPIAPDLTIARAPELVLAEAHRAAKALTNVLDAKPKKIMFNGERYLEFEDWSTLARFYGVTCKITSTKFVEYGDVKGFSATAVALRADGAAISAAEAECLTDESKWRSRPVYEWRETARGRQRIRIGEENVPMFQLKSMSQTRACSKVLRNILSWVVVLAGYKPTPAEELPDADPEPTPISDGAVNPSKTPTRADRGSRAAPRADAGRDASSPISPAMRKKLFAQAREHGWTTDTLRAKIAAAFGVDSSADLRAGDFDQVLAIVRRGPPPAAPVEPPNVDDIPFSWFLPLLLSVGAIGSVLWT